MTIRRDIVDIFFFYMCSCASASDMEKKETFIGLNLIDLSNYSMIMELAYRTQALVRGLSARAHFNYYYVIFIYAHA